MHQTRLLFLLPTEPMTNDTVSYVRRAALIASALIMIQHTEVTCPKVKEFRAMYAKIIADKHEDVMVKLGAIFAQGIIDAGGRNVTVSLQSRTGHTNMMAVVGMLIFTQVRKIVLIENCVKMRKCFFFVVHFSCKIFLKIRKKYY